MFANNVRHLMLALSTACLTLVISNSLALNFTVICMDSPINGTLAPMFSLQQQGWLFSAIAMGQLLGTLPITFITTHFGIRKMFTAYGLLSSFATIFIPPSIWLGGFPALMLMRIFQGIGVASIWVVIGSISAHWAPLASSGIFLSILSCNLQFGPIISMPLAAQLCSSEHFGWSPVYYFLGSISLLIFVAFYCFFRDLPSQQKHISQKELALIQSGKSPISFQINGKSAKIPYRAILSDPVFWGIFISTASANMAFQIFWQYGPLYLNKALGLEVAKTGFVAAFPFLLAAIVKIFAGQISDRIGFISEKWKVILFASISQYLMAACFFALAILPLANLANVPLMQTCFTGATVFSGLNAVGIVKSTQLVSCQFSHILFSWNTLMLSLIMLILPIVVSFLTPTNSVDEWSHVFLFITASVVAGTTFFNFTAEVEPRPWASRNSSRSSENEERIFTIEKCKNIQTFD